MARLGKWQRLERHTEILRQKHQKDREKKKRQKENILKVVQLAGSGIRVDFESLMKLLHISLLHRHLPLNQKDVLKTKKHNDA